MDSFNELWERKQTRSLLGRNFLIAICLPLAACLLVWLYFRLTGRTMERADIKRMVLVLWLGTMIVLCWKGLQGVGVYRHILRLFRKKAEPEGGITYVIKRRQSEKWEQKKTSRIVHEMLATLFLVPLISYFLVWAFFFIVQTGLVRGDWKIAAICIWAGTLLCLIRVGFKASRDKLVYSRRGMRE